MAEDDKPSQPAIPAWQQKSQQQDQQTPPPDPPQSASSSPPATDPSPEPSVVHESSSSDSSDSSSSTTETSEPPSFSRDEVLSFLSDPSILSAPASEKRTFLASKGVPASLVDDILLSQTAPPPSTSFSPSSFSTPAQQPPIVTYPEFLLKPTKPPPLVTLPRLLGAAYALASASAVFYGAQRFLLAPMAAALTHARHDFAAHARGRADALADRLAGVVSRLPPPQSEEKRYEAEDEEDPTELFYADVGVQTSPPRSRSSSSSAAGGEGGPAAVVEQHAARVRALKAALDGLGDVETRGAEVGAELDRDVAALREYLNGLVYSPPANAEWGQWSPASAPVTATKDAVGKLRDEIRGVKGVLLSARRFPARGGVRAA